VLGEEREEGEGEGKAADAGEAAKASDMGQQAQATGGEATDGAWVRTALAAELLPNPNPNPNPKPSPCCCLTLTLAQTLAPAAA